MTFSTYVHIYQYLDGESNVRKPANPRIGSKASVTAPWPPPIMLRGPTNVTGAIYS